MNIWYIVLAAFVGFWVGFAICGMLSFNGIYEDAQKAKERELRLKNMLDEIKNK